VVVVGAAHQVEVPAGLVSPTVKPYTDVRLTVPTSRGKAPICVLSIVSTSGDTVGVQLDATQTDGTHKYFAGTYTVKDGVIVAADNH
jgi:hypothetical protein